MAGKGDEVQETPQQRAQAQFAQRSFQDWKQRWLPLQRRLAAQIQASGQSGSPQERLAEGKASTDTAAQFAQASKAAEERLAGSGAGLNSGRAVAALGGMGDDEAASTGLGLTITDQQMDDAYMEGLSALTAMGRGERASVGDALTTQARQSSRQAVMDAENSLASRAGNAELAGQFAGYGLQQGLKNFQGTGIGTTNDLSGVTGLNAMDRFMRAGTSGD
jgi:hypothetical protein